MSKRKESKISFGPEIIFYGGVGVVTGSCYRVTDKGLAFCVDYGLFQGRDARDERGVRYNFVPPRVILDGVEIIAFSHSHMDHVGLYPRAFNRGLSPTGVTTETAAHFIEPLLYNSARIQANEDPQNRLYNESDVEEAMRHLLTVDPFTQVPISSRHNNATAEFLPNGHVMGANSILVRLGGGRNILFTGDMGKPHQSLGGGYLDFASQYPKDEVHVLVAESTNFNKEPVSFEEKRKNLLNAIQSAWKNGGNPLLPMLSFHRLQEVVEMLANSQHEGLIPDDCKIFIDAPLGMTILKAFRELPPDQLSKQYGDDPDYYKTDAESMARFDTDKFIIINSHEDSVSLSSALANYRGKAIIIASGGMGDYGRSVNYLHGDFGKNPNNLVVLTCHQVEGTEGAELVRDKNVQNRNSAKGAGVVQVDGFTSHISGPDETFDFFKLFNLRKLDKVIVTHGNDPARLAMAQEFKRRKYGNEIIVPRLYQKAKI